MEAPQTLHEALSALSNEISKNSQLVSEVEALTKDVQANFALNQEVSSKLSQQEAYNKELLEKIEQLQSEAQTVDQKVAATLASLAVPPVKSVQQSDTSASNQVSARDRLAQIKDPMQRAVFRRDNFEDLLKNR